MRHQKAGRKLNMTKSHREAMMRNMVSSLFRFRRIETTDTRAKEVRKLAEKLITFAKRGDLHARRQVLRYIPDRTVVHELFETIGPAFADRDGGYTRVIKTGRRPGDNAPVSMVELVGLEPKIEELEERAEKKKAKKRERVAAAQEAQAVAGAPPPTEESKK
ncbi:MAG: 50S ribosomal protein L17 [Candidatus Eisenbacteria bacterium]|nr:50S ribosomal protein L17 [Candidatus Eisenbacteria bacterium]